MFVLGVDIGYSNLKLAIGQSGSEPKTIILPAGAGPADRMPERIGGGDDETCLYVSIMSVGPLVFLLDAFKAGNESFTRNIPPQKPIRHFFMPPC